MLLPHIQSHSFELLAKLHGRALAAVGQKQKLLFVFGEPVDKLRYAVKNLIAVIDDTVHIAYKTFFF